MIDMDEKLLKYKSLIELTKTTEDVVSLDEEIGLLLQSLFHFDKGKFEEILESQIRIRVAIEIRKLLQTNIFMSKEEIKALLTDAYHTICVLPILRLTLAFEPSESVINSISYWARQKLEAGILLDLSLDRSLLGGAVIMHKGKFYDYSLRNKLREIFEKGDLSL